MTKLNKKIALAITMILLLTSLVPSFTATTAPKTVTITQFTQTLLTTLQIPYTDPIQEAVNQKWVSKGHKLIASPSAAITKEQSAQLLYSVLRTKENVKPDLYYERLLTYFMGDVKLIDSSYKRAVFTTIMNGFYEPQLKNEKKYFNPKNKVTEAEMKVMMTRLLDKAKRYDPFQKKVFYIPMDESKNWGSAPTIKTVYPNIVYPKLSKVKKIMAFENGIPVEDKAKVLKELDEEEHNRYEMFFSKYYKYEDVLNRIAVLEADVITEEMARAKRIAEVDHWYDVATKFTKAYFNVDYKNTKVTETALKAVMPSNYYSKELIENHFAFVKKNKISIQSYAVSDKSLFYDGFNISYVRTRVYFKMISSNKTVPFGIVMDNKEDKVVNLRSNTWYCVDYDIAVADYSNYENESWSWNGDEHGNGGFEQISDIYEVSPKK